MTPSTRRASLILVVALNAACRHGEVTLQVCPTGKNRLSPPTHCDCSSDTDLLPTREKIVQGRVQSRNPHREGDIDVAPLGRWIEASLYNRSDRSITVLADLVCPNGGGPVVLVPKGPPVRETPTESRHDFLMLLPTPRDVADTSAPLCTLRIAWRGHSSRRIHRISHELYVNHRVITEPSASALGGWDYVDSAAVPLSVLEPPLSPPPPRYCPDWRTPPTLAPAGPSRTP